MCRRHCLFSFFNVLFPVLEIRTLACLFLQSYCISVHVAVIWFLFRCLFWVVFFFFLNVVSMWFWSGNHLAWAMRNERRRHRRKIYHAVSVKVNGFQACLPKNYVYIPNSFGRYVIAAWIIITGNIFPVPKVLYFLCYTGFVWRRVYKV